MRKSILSIVAAIGFMFVVSAASAYAQTITVNVPFEFKVGEKTLPAGTYRVKKHSNNATTIVVSKSDLKETGISLSQNMYTNGNPEKSKLVFHRYGNQSFLSEIVIQGRQIGYELSTSKSERKTIEEARTRYLTQNIVKPEIVEIIAEQ